MGQVDDQAGALRALMGQPVSLGKRYNLSGSDAFSAEGYVDQFAEVLGVKADKVFIPPAHMDALFDGEIRLEHRNRNGEAVMHRVFGPYESFGDVALLGEGSRYYTANTSSLSIVIRTPLSLLREVLATDPNLATAWIHAVSTDLQRRERRLADSVAQHIAHPAFFDAA